MLPGITAEQKAYDGIIDLMLSKTFAPGDRLMETELAEKLHVSRTPVRNALRQLIAEGLLETDHHRGCHIPKLNAPDMQQNFQARIFLEGKAAMEAAHLRTEEDISTLRSLLEQEKDFYKKGEVKLYTDVNKKLHLTIASLSRNTYIEKFVRQTFWRSELYIFYFDRFYAPELSKELLRDPHKSISCIEHEKIVSAIESRDSSAAEVVMKAHLQSTLDYLYPRFRVYGGTGVIGLTTQEQS
ncbi:MAG: hypothetical protein PWR02_984 [Synergistales bacterium]|nr:hypothetical protein [Synergistales bacterium]MDK2959696.1 hypothetical protein [Synergistaceae bacterium]MDN5335958.1 hypothetical protein [Synergistales bacterium]